MFVTAILLTLSCMSSQSVLTIPASPDVFGTCPDTWWPMGASCYLFRPDDHVTWEEAQNACRTFGGPRANLVSILNSYENEYVLSNMYKLASPQRFTRYWIGLRRTQVDDYYIWIDSERHPEFTLWRYPNPGMPNSSLCADADGREMYGKWTSQPCNSVSETRPYICKMATEPAEEHYNLPMSAAARDSSEKAGKNGSDLVVAIVVAVILILLLVIFGSLKMSRIKRRSRKQPTLIELRRVHRFKVKTSKRSASLNKTLGTSETHETHEVLSSTELGNSLHPGELPTLLPKRVMALRYSY